MEILAFKQYRIDETSSGDFIQLEDIEILNSVYDGDSNDRIVVEYQLRNLFQNMSTMSH